MPDNDRIEADWHDLAAGRLSPGHRVNLPVLTGSMMTLLPVNSVVEIVAADGRDAAVGDVVCFRQGEKLTVHRVLLRVPCPGGPLLYQKGDANARGAWIRAGAVVGIVVAVVMRDGRRTALDTPPARRAARGRVLVMLRRDLKARVLSPLRRLLGASPDRP